MVFRSRAEWQTAAHTMVGMRGWSFPIGRILGVDGRIHTFFLLLLGLSISYASMTGATGGRGFALWLLLVLAVIVREIVRGLGAAWFGLELCSMVLLPTGALFSYATPEANELAATPGMQKRMGVIGPITNIIFGLMLAAIALTFSPEVNPHERPGFPLPPSQQRGGSIFCWAFLTCCRPPPSTEAASFAASLPK